MINYQKKLNTNPSVNKTYRNSSVIQNLTNNRSRNIDMNCSYYQSKNLDINHSYQQVINGFKMHRCDNNVVYLEGVEVTKMVDNRLQNLLLNCQQQMYRELFRHDRNINKFNYYEGGFENGLKSGEGYENYKNGFRYIGQFKNGVKTGMAKFIF